MVVLIFSGCSTGVPLQQTKRAKPVQYLVPLKQYKSAKSVADIPRIYIENIETGGICRGRLKGLQNWVEAGY